MKSYQTLAVIGGILGLIIIFSAYALLGVATILSTSFGGETPEGVEQANTQIAISIIFYIIAIIIPFVIKQTKPLGWILIGLSIATLISAGFFGIIGFALLIAGGISAIRQKEKPIDNARNEQEKKENALDILKTRYARGEITKEEFERMREDLGHT